MDFTTPIVIFLAFTMVTVVTNTLLILFAYKGFASVTTKVTAAAREFETSSETREWIASIQRASEQAVTVTEMTKQKMTEYDPVLDDLQSRYAFMLASLDTRVERVTETVTETATRARDAVIEPAEKFSNVASGVKNALSFLSPESGNHREP